jgi:hypothetical protein
VLPDGSDLIELSIKVEPRDAAAVGAEFEALLSARGLDTKGDQQTKTRTALRFFTQGAA